MSDWVKLLTVHEKGGADGTTRVITTRYERDLLGHVKEEVQDVDGLELTTRCEYDASENLIKRTHAVDLPEEVIDEWTYDERNRLITETRGIVPAGGPVDPDEREQACCVTLGHARSGARSALRPAHDQA